MNASIKEEYAKLIRETQTESNAPGLTAGRRQELQNQIVELQNSEQAALSQLAVQKQQVLQQMTEAGPQPIPFGADSSQPKSLASNATVLPGGVTGMTSPQPFGTTPRSTSNATHAGRFTAATPDVALSQKIQSGSTAMTVANGVATGFVLTAVNRGSGATSGSVTVTDNLHPGLVFQSQSSDKRCSASGSTITCTTPSLGPNEATDFTIGVVVSSTAAASGTILKIDNVAAASTSGDADPSNNGSNPVTLTVYGPNVPSLFVENRIYVNGLTTHTNASAGDSIRFRFTLQNNSSSPANAATTPVVIHDQLDSRLTFVPNSVDPRTDRRCTAAGQAVTCTKSTALPVGIAGWDTFEIIIKPTNAAALTPYSSPIPNEVTVTAANLPEAAGGFGQTLINMLPGSISLSQYIVRADGTTLPNGPIRNNTDMTLRFYGGYNGFNASVLPPVLTMVLGPSFRFVPSSTNHGTDSRCVANGQTVTCTPIQGASLSPSFDIVVHVSDNTAQTQVVHASNRATATMPGIPPVNSDIAFDILPPGTPLTPYSGQLTVSAVDPTGYDWGVSVGFQSIIGNGVVSAKPIETRPPAPAGYSLISNEYEITLAPASVATGPFSVCITWTYSPLTAQDRMWAYEGDTPLGDITTPNGGTTNRRCGATNRLTRFVLVRPNP